MRNYWTFLAKNTLRNKTNNNDTKVLISYNNVKNFYLLKHLTLRLKIK